MLSNRCSYPDRCGVALLALVAITPLSSSGCTRAEESGPGAIVASGSASTVDVDSGQPLDTVATTNQAELATATTHVDDETRSDAARASDGDEAPAKELPLPAFDHSRWDAIVKRHVDRNGWVDYAGLNAESGAGFRAYLAELAAADLSALKTREDQLAFWINAYNALCVKKLLDNEIPASVPHALVFGTNIFTERDHRIAGKKRSLDDIEHGILRPEFKEPRVHATIVCGASSCPRLRDEAYDPRRLEKQLDEEVRSWLFRELDKSGERKNRLDAKTKIFHASKIFDWFQEDFGDSDDGVIRFVARFAPEEERRLLESGAVRVKYLDYDWSLNGR